MSLTQTLITALVGLSLAGTLAAQDTKAKLAPVTAKAPR
jgi:hypothetical protein